MVTGRVAPDELVENAVAMADAIALKCLNGFILVNIQNTKGRTTKI